MTADEVTNTTKEKESSRRSRRSRRRQAVTKSQQSGETRTKDRPTPARREGKNKGNIVTRTLSPITNYFSSTWAELQKVTWPTREESLRLSGIVIAVTIAFSIVLGLLDFMYGELFRLGFNTPVVFIIVGVVLVVVVGGLTLLQRRSA